MTVKKINQQIFTNVLIVFLITLLFLSLFFVFVYISSSHQNQLLKTYLSQLNLNQADFKTIMKKNFLNPQVFYGLQYGAIGCFGLSVLLSFLYGYSGKKNVEFYQRKYLIATWLITSFLFITIFLFSFAEYEYDTFIQWAKSLNTSADDNFNILKNYFNFPINSSSKNFAKILADLASANQNTGLTWIGRDEVWWLAAFEFIVIIFLFLKLSFKAEKAVANIISFKKEEEVLNIRNSFNQGYLKRFLSSLLIPSEFNISLWIIIFSLVLFVPQIIYIVKLSLPNNSLYYFLHYSFIDANLFPTSKFASSSDYHALWKITQNQFVIMYLPIVGLAIVSIMILSFIFILLTKPNISRFGFLSLYAVYFVFSLLAIIFFLVSQIQLEQLVSYWNVNANSLADVLKKLGGGPLPNFWIARYELITSGILSFAFLTAGSIIILTHIAKIRQKKAQVIIDNQQLY